MRWVRNLLICSMVLACASAAQAGGYGGQYGGFYGGGYGGCNGGFYGGLGLGYGYPFVTSAQACAPRVPYFALHPPVYYGQRYTRPYGASPFASPPMLQANSNYAPAPHVDRAPPGPTAVVVMNPHYQKVESVRPEEVVSGKAAPQQVVVAPVKPLVVENPYYRSPEVQYTKAKNP